MTRAQRSYSDNHRVRYHPRPSGRNRQTLSTFSMTGCGGKRLFAHLIALGAITCLILLWSPCLSSYMVYEQPRQSYTSMDAVQTFPGTEEHITPVNRIREPEAPKVIEEQPKDTEVPPVPKERPLKKILFWNDAYQDKHFGFGEGHELFKQARCKVDACFATSDRSKFPLEEVDAVIWHSRSGDMSLPAVRSPHTRYVLWVRESASYPGNIIDFRYTFNWTYTYRLDSDFLNAYGFVIHRPHPLVYPLPRNYAAGKTKLAAWFVSNCHPPSGRDLVAKKLQDYMKIDVFGKCGPFTCRQNAICMQMLEKRYKFYLSFENSLCRDYATEKFFKILKLDIVPIVYGLANYSAIAPPHSYIDALAFPTAKDLASYILYLDKNDTAYNEYFQ
ncbi:alpha-(1,3)-fucosyltransferase C-like [Penaeus japonicus]|uniref:alpha-(1,3)-fucosyltransferase C-like n=1 Tax=Penaeus japonicus TaxID=27405 RepID=UPI001C70C85A|nr:alpha-(1,3)-fucosyltransferase C-like [Penaeus japonicus]